MTVPLDGYVFERCRFDNCKLATDSGDFTLLGCYIAEDCRVLVGHPTAKLVRLVLHVYAKQGLLTPLGNEKQIVKRGMNPDGTVTIE